MNYRIVAKFSSGCVSLPLPTLEEARLCLKAMATGEGESIVSATGVWIPEPLGEVEWVEIQRQLPVPQPPDRYQEGRERGLSPAEAEARATAYGYLDGLAGRLEAAGHETYLRDL